VGGVAALSLLWMLPGRAPRDAGRSPAGTGSSPGGSHGARVDSWPTDDGFVASDSVFADSALGPVLAARGMVVYEADTSDAEAAPRFGFVYVEPVDSARMPDGSLLLDTAAFVPVRALLDPATRLDALGADGRRDLRIARRALADTILHSKVEVTASRRGAKFAAVSEGSGEGAAEHHTNAPTCQPRLTVPVWGGDRAAGGSPWVVGLRAGRGEPIALASWGAGVPPGDSARDAAEGSRLAALTSENTARAPDSAEFTVLAFDRFVADGREFAVVRAQREWIEPAEDGDASRESPQVEFLLVIAERSADDARARLVPVWRVSRVGTWDVTHDPQPTWRLGVLRLGPARRLTLVTERRQESMDGEVVGEFVVRMADGSWREAGRWWTADCW